MATGSALSHNAHASAGQIKIVVHDQNLSGYISEIIQNRTDRLTAEVHERQWFNDQNLATLDESGSPTRPELAFLKLDPTGGYQPVRHEETCIVTSPLIIPARISQPHHHGDEIIFLRMQVHAPSPGPGD